MSKLLLRVGILVAFAYTADVHKFFSHAFDDSLGDKSELSPQEALMEGQKVCELAKKELSSPKARNGQYSFEEYYSFLHRAKTTTRREGWGIMDGGRCVTEVQELTRFYIEEMARRGRQEEAYQGQEAAYEKYKTLTDPDWREKEARSRAEFYSKDLPAFKNWIIKTYFFWSVLSFFYFLIFWKEKDENIEHLGWIAALAYAVFHPYFFGRSIFGQGYRIARWVWFESQVRRMEDNLFRPLSAEVRAAAKEFARSNRSFTEERKRLRNGITPRHCFAAALGATILLLSVPQALASNSEVVSDTQEVSVVSATDSSPPDIGWSALLPVTPEVPLLILVNEVRFCLYRIFVPDPPPREFIVVPIVLLGLSKPSS